MIFASWRASEISFSLGGNEDTCIFSSSSFFGGGVTSSSAYTLRGSAATTAANCMPSPFPLNLSICFFMVPIFLNLIDVRRVSLMSFNANFPTTSKRARLAISSSQKVCRTCFGSTFSLGTTESSSFLRYNKYVASCTTAADFHAFVIDLAPRFLPNRCNGNARSAMLLFNTVISIPNACASFDALSLSTFFSFSVRLCSLFAEDTEVITNLRVIDG
mmetsp:Transcript_4029/g.12378  ORF Transcript_4029/g.12378 Transcript_4029/m.12378 type:complete len:217 (-) Transcript_4029:708-1358(-)